MPDLFDLLVKWWKQVLAIVIVSVVITGTITFLKPKQYLSVTTAVPASSFASDKSKIFNQNIAALYSTLGTPDDLDMIVGTANLDTVYLAVTGEFNLFDHYKMSEKGNAALNKATALLKKNTKVLKSEYGELKVKVWDTDKNLAPQLANSIMSRLQMIHQDLQGAGNEAALKGLRTAREKIRSGADSALTKNYVMGGAMEEQLRQYDKLIGEYQLMVDSKPPVLIIVERAKPSDWSGKPRTGQIIIATAVLSFLFAFFVALILERRKTPRT